MKQSQIYISNDGGFAIDLHEVVSVSTYSDIDTCKRCKQDHPIDRLDIYVRCHKESYCVRRDLALDIMRAWRTYREEHPS